jgi:hypothetical protein
MDKASEERAQTLRIAGDIITVLDLSRELGWEPIRGQSISRIIYLASVLFSFRRGDKENPFARDYHFSVDLTGPFYPLIDNALAFLESNSYVTQNKQNDILLGPEKLPRINDLPNYEIKAEWIKTVFLIISVYGESRVYEFIIRDPQYQENLNTNAIKEINIDSNNKTQLVLNEFKQTFEESLGKDSYKIDDREYIQLYFEYIFSKVVKGELEL